MSILPQVKTITVLCAVFLGTFNILWADEIEIKRLPMALGGWVDFGRAYKIDTDKFTDTDITSKDVVLSHTGIYFGQSAIVNDRLRLDIGFAGFYFFPFPQHPEQGWSSYLAAGTAVSVAAGTYKFGDLDNPWLSSVIGWSSYKYNRFTKNFGEYLFRTESYPVYIRTGEYGAINNARTPVLGTIFGFNFLDGMIKNDFIVSLSTRIPIADVSVTDIATFNMGNIFEIGGGIQFSRILPMFENKTDAIFKRENGKLNHSYLTWTAADDAWVQARIAEEDAAGVTPANSLLANYRVNPLVVGETYWLGNQTYQPGSTESEIANAYSSGVDVFDGTGTATGDLQRIELADMTTIGFQSTKVMGKAGFDIKPLLGIEDMFNPDALQLYGEITLLGLEDHPVFYTDKMERMPMMAGFNIPTFKILDYLTIEVEYLKNPWLNSFVATQFFGQPLPKLLNGNDANAIPELTLDQSRARYTAQLTADLDLTNATDLAEFNRITSCTGDQVNSATGGRWKEQCEDESHLNYHEDDLKWSVTAARSFSPVTLMFQVANDHFAPIQGNLSLRSTELTNRKASWYYTFKMQVDL